MEACTELVDSNTATAIVEKAGVSGIVCMCFKHGLSVSWSSQHPAVEILSLLASCAVAEFGGDISAILAATFPGLGLPRSPSDPKPLLSVDSGCETISKETYTYTDTHVHTKIHTYKLIYTYVCTYVCVCIYTYMYLSLSLSSLRNL